MRIIIAPDSFKGTLTAREAAEAMAEGVKDAVPDADVVCMPVGDGGEGTADALKASLSDVETVCCPTVDALGRPISATYLISGGITAIIESAAASGLTLIKPVERDILKADTRGTGKLIADAHRRGIRNFIIGMGGTATCDGGWGAYTLLEQLNLEDSRFTLLCDVDNPLCGESGAAPVFGPQKGASGEQINFLERRLSERAEIYASKGGRDVRNLKYAGAAGGLAGMLMACYSALPVPGIQKVLELLDFDSVLADADLVITGEGKADRTSLHGKAPVGILRAASEKAVPVAMIGGKIEDEALLKRAGFKKIVRATPDTPDPALSAAIYVSEAAKSLFR